MTGLPVGARFANDCVVRVVEDVDDGEVGSPRRKKIARVPPLGTHDTSGERVWKEEEEENEKSRVKGRTSDPGNDPSSS